MIGNNKLGVYRRTAFNLLDFMNYIGGTVTFGIILIKLILQPFLELSYIMDAIKNLYLIHQTRIERLFKKKE